MIISDENLENYINSYVFEKDYFIENRLYGSYVAFNGTDEFFFSIISFLKNPKSYLGFIDSKNYLYKFEESEKLTENDQKANLLLETSGRSYKKASNDIQYDWYIRFENQEEDILKKAIKYFFDHALILQNFWERKSFPNVREEESLLPNFNLEWEEIDDEALDKFCIFLSSKLKDKKKYHIYSNKNLNKVFFSLLEDKENASKNNLLPELEEIHKQINSLNQKLASNIDKTDEEDLKESIKKGNERIKFLEVQIESFEKQITEKDECINSLENELARVGASRNKIEKNQKDLFKSFFPKLKYLHEGNFFSLFKTSNADIFLRCMGEPLNIAFNSPDDEVESILRKKIGVEKVKGTNTWFKISAKITNSYAEGMEIDSRTGWKGGVKKGIRTLDQFIYLSYSILRGNRSIYVHYDTENEHALKRLQQNDPPDFKKEF